MQIPDYQTVMLPVLKHAATREETSSAECADVVADEFHLSADDRNQLLPSGGRTVIRNRVGWARYYLVKAGVL